ncbi:MAG: GntR family transcriptional regulator [Verrucomicrobiae bacterium]|nr:GntR family transcriptional regulator [Verrucomicrobiae bacterium]
MIASLDIKPIDPVHKQIERALRQQIQTGKLEPQERLPSTAKLASQWGVTNTAVQKAMERLVADGLIVRSRKRGTFVRPATDQVVIGVLFGTSLADERSHFARAIFDAIRHESEESTGQRYCCRFYDRFAGVSRKTNIEDLLAYQQVVVDLQNFSFKGIIQIHGGFGDYDGAKLEFGLPTVRLASPHPEARADVILDFRRFSRESIERLVRAGIRRIAYLRTLDTALNTDRDLEGIQDAVKAHPQTRVKIVSMPHVQKAGEDFEQSVYQSALKTIGQWQRANQWPEAILISDDIAARSVVLALMRKDVSMPEGVRLVTLANEGIHHQYGLPVERYEFSPRAAARALLSVLWKRIRGEDEENLPLCVSRGSVENIVGKEQVGSKDSLDVLLPN